MTEEEISQQEFEASMEEQKEIVRNFTIEELTKHLQNSLMSTNLILDSYQQGGGFLDDSSNILFMAIIEHRRAIENTLEWIEFNFDEEINEENEIKENISKPKNKTINEDEDDLDEL